MQSSSGQPLVGEERYVTTLIKVAKETSTTLVHLVVQRTQATSIGESLIVDVIEKMVDFTQSIKIQGLN